MKKKQYYLIALLCTLSMIFLIHICQNLGKKVKIDFTDENLFTLSEGTKSILRKVNHPLILKLYYSKKASHRGPEAIGEFTAYFEYIKNLLEEYVENSRNNLTLDIIDPRPDTIEEEDAIAYGLRKFHLSENEKYFFGLVVEGSGGVEKVIEFFDPSRQDSVEYQITKLIYTASGPKKKKIGILSSLGVMKKDLGPYIQQMMALQGKTMERSWIATELLKDFFDVIEIKSDSKEIHGIDLLIVIGAEGMKEERAVQIDQYLLRGGRILFLVDPKFVSDQRRDGDNDKNEDEENRVSDLFYAWGVTFDFKNFVGDRYLSAYGRTNPAMPPTRILQILKCDQRCTEATKDPVTSSLSDLMFVLPGELSFVKKQGLSVIPLISTTERGNTYQASPQELNHPALLSQKFQDGDKKDILVLKFMDLLSLPLRINREIQVKI